MASEPFVKLNCIQSKYDDEFKVEGGLCKDKKYIMNHIYCGIIWFKR